MPPPAPRRQLNVRLPPDLIDRIEADGRAKQDVVEDAVRAWFSDDSNVIAGDSSENGGGRADDSSVLSIDSKNDSNVIAALIGQLDEKDRQIAAKDEQLTATIVLLHDAITPPPQLPAAEQEAQAGRRWWEFWKR